MLTILATAAVAVTPSAMDRAATKDAAAVARPFVAITPSAVRAFPNIQLCKSAGRMQTSVADPALLLRPQDRADIRTRRLIDLPPAEACLIGSAMGLGR